MRLPRRCFTGVLIALVFMIAPTSDAVEQKDLYSPDVNNRDLISLMEEGWRKGTIDAAFLLNRNLNSSNIQVTVKRNTATLIGEVESAVKKSLAAEIARSVAGIEEVKNQLRVVPVAGQANPRALEQATRPNHKDILLTAKVNQRLLSSEHLRSVLIDVHTHDGVVELSGNAPEDSIKDLAYYIAKNVKGVKSVDNKIKVRVSQ